MTYIMLVSVIPKKRLERGPRVRREVEHPGNFGGSTKIGQLTQPYNTPPPYTDQHVEHRKDFYTTIKKHATKNRKVTRPAENGKRC